MASKPYDGRDPHEQPRSTAGLRDEIMADDIRRCVDNLNEAMSRATQAGLLVNLTGISRCSGVATPIGSARITVNYVRRLKLEDH